ncbi:DUF2793 domain-containing protein [Tateyamaria sp. ANG-S1]|uniref:DUF2793 domain-containing protein n=1 Tax=Tateyamaria sp. ANG-S1 TaxID=1577905 RepID=UPI000690C1C1|nr:DUF2793 domain-containing protein [Tateyamaria sp. ANG-S1]
MTDTTARLGLPLILPSQAQKHVTHNEALALLDGITQLVLTERGAAAPPALPAPGETYALGPAPTGVWTGQGGMLAQWGGSHWQFIPPQEGWLAWDLDAGTLLVHRAGAWQAVVGDFAELGIGTSADAINRFAVASEASLLTHAGAGHQLKINKAATADTNALLFQTNWSGRAEMGCAGNDDFSIKVSQDGTTFHDGLVVDAATGAVRFPNGVAGTGSAAGPMGGQTVAFVGERNSPLNVGHYLSFGNGATDTAGPVLPFDAKVMAATLSVTAGLPGVTRFHLLVDEVADPSFDITLDYSGAGVFQTATVDFSVAPRAVPAGSALSLVCANTTGANKVVGTLYVTFD